MIFSNSCIKLNLSLAANYRFYVCNFSGRGITEENFPLIVSSRFNLPFLIDSPGTGKVS